MSNRPPHESDDLDAFEPGASFADAPNEPGGDQPGDLAPAAEALPSWLQNFADTVSTTDDRPSPDAPDLGGLPRPDVGPPEDAEASASNLSGWLDESSPTSLPVASAFDATVPDSSHPVGAPDGIGFFSDDDLPEWLRSLGPSTAAQASVAPVSAMPAPASVATLTIPTVARVWVTPHEAAPEPPSAALFASIAGAIDERPVTGAADASYDSAAPLLTMPVDQPVIATAAAAKVTRPDNGRWSRKFIWFVVLLLLLAVVMLAILAQL